MEDGAGWSGTWRAQRLDASEYLLMHSLMHLSMRRPRPGSGVEYGSGRKANRIEWPDTT